MTNSSISDLASGGAVSSTDIFPVVQTPGAGPVKVTAAQIGDYVLNPRVNSTTSFSSPLAWNSNNFDQYEATAQAGSLTINADSGSPVNAQKISFRFKDNGMSQTLTWTTGSSNSFRAVGATLPTTTVANKTVYIGCIYNSAASRWDVVAVAQEA